MDIFVCDEGQLGEFNKRMETLHSDLQSITKNITELKGNIRDSAGWNNFGKKETVAFLDLVEQYCNALSKTSGPTDIISKHISVYLSNMEGFNDKSNAYAAIKNL